jgi:LysM repeat protein
MNFLSFRTAVQLAAALGVSFSATLGSQTLKGSAGSVDRMYSVAAKGGFDFFRTTVALESAIRRGTLLPLSGSSPDYELHEVEHPALLPEARLFVQRLARQYRGNCGEKMVVTGAARPMNMRLANASDRSVHPTGMAVDIRSVKIGARCQSFLRSVLTSLEKAGVLEATEERNPPHFHVAVYPTPYRSYVTRLTGATVAVAEAPASSSGPADSPEPNVSTYLVRRGDSLWRIATRHDTSVSALQELNRLRTDRIHPGQVILVPTGGQ